ncbi:ciliogenesis and planar polarity effector 2-like isoform X2 [Athalia rosae]|uniref:ciliogenesis and planar polarity effector 2-like isoform X2 n=1 Tax=Athalia rosae TaxID=37344 RepID=UPI002033C413|nr:ciliogenesis and planar polarity effector 2-like isoform X2 [Athalia rosae]
MNNAIKMDWLSSAEGESLLHHFYVRSTNNRRFYGKSGVGKTSVVSRLAGITKGSSSNSNGSATYLETNGIKRTTIFWPVKIWDKVVLFKLQFWDASENSIKKYSHILPMCKDKADAICSVFSFEDATSFSELPQMMNSMAAIQAKPASIVVGTRYKVWSTLPVSDAQVKEFEEKWKVKVIRIDTNKSVTRPEIFDCSYQLNWICSALWDRDQEFISKQVVQV